MNGFPEHFDIGQDVLYADDDSGQVSAKDPDELVRKLQIFADSSVNWIQDNKMVCSALKTKLLVSSTKELRESKLSGGNILILVGGQIISESPQEKLLGITMSNDLSWNSYLYGCKEAGGNTIGLVSQLSKRVGMIKSLSKYIDGTQLNSVINGLFTSKLLYCLPLFSNVWGMLDMDDTNRRYSAFTKEDLRRLQVLQNRILRIKCKNHDMNTPTLELLKSCQDLSVQQLSAFHTVLNVFKIIHSRQPKYLAESLKLSRPEEENIFPQRQANKILVKRNLTLSRSGFLYRGAQLWNLLPLELRTCSDLNTFRRELRNWVIQVVPAKP